MFFVHYINCYVNKYKIKPAWDIHLYYIFYVFNHFVFNMCHINKNFVNFMNLSCDVRNRASCLSLLIFEIDKCWYALLLT